MNKALKIIASIIIIGGIVFIGYKLSTTTDKKEETQEIAKDKTTAPEKSDKSEGAGKGEKDDVALPVRAVQIKRGNLPLRLNISASADVWEKTSIRSEVSGTIQEIPVTVGKWVQKDQLLVKVDDSEIKLAVESRESEKLRSLSRYLVSDETTGGQAKTNLSGEQLKDLETLKQKYLKALKDLDTGKITRGDFDKIDDEYQSALIFSGNLREEVRKAQEGLSSAIISLKQAQLDLKRTRILSPFPGIIADLKISKGEKVSGGQELLKVVNLNSLYLKGFALESEIANLKVGTKVRIKFDSFPESFYYGEIQAISPEIDPTRKTITVFVKVDNKDKLFLPGMHAEIDVEYKVFENVIKVPRNAVVYRQERYLVFVVRDLKGTTGTANWEYVTIGHQNDDEIEILTGVQEGDLVLIEGQQTLAHQSRVKIIQD
jgi:multidrug efflux pump subunit AcrA (membrane-fusion protein)